jgi:hypothetical protein
MKSLPIALLSVGLVSLLAGIGCSDIPTATTVPEEVALSHSMPDAESYAVSNAQNGNSSEVFKARLYGDYVEVESSGQGLATFRRQGDLMTYRLVATKLSSIVSAKLTICGTVRVAREAVRLFSSGAGVTDDEVYGAFAEGVITEDMLMGSLAGKTIADLVEMFETGHGHVIIGTQGHPAGEIGGPVVPARDLRR